MNVSNLQPMVIGLPLTGPFPHQSVVDLAYSLWNKRPISVRHQPTASKPTTMTERLDRHRSHPAYAHPLANLS